MTESRNYDLRDFDVVDVATGVRAIVTTGGDYSVRVEAHPTILERIDVSVAGGRLHIGIGRGVLDFVFGGGLIELLKHNGDFGITAYVTLPILNGAEASSGARVEASNVKSDRFNSAASSGARLTLLGVSGGIFRAEASSGGQIEIEGAVTEFDAGASSGGHIRADRLVAAGGRLEASSGGHIETNVTTRVRVNASSGGHVRVDGNPRDRDINTSSGGHVAV